MDVKPGRGVRVGRSIIEMASTITIAECPPSESSCCCRVTRSAPYIVVSRRSEAAAQPARIRRSNIRSANPDRYREFPRLARPARPLPAGSALAVPRRAAQEHAPGSRLDRRRGAGRGTPDRPVSRRRRAPAGSSAQSSDPPAATVVGRFGAEAGTWLAAADAIAATEQATTARWWASTPVDPDAATAAAATSARCRRRRCAAPSPFGSYAREKSTSWSWGARVGGIGVGARSCDRGRRQPSGQRVEDVLGGPGTGRCRCVDGQLRIAAAA